MPELAAAGGKLHLTYIAMNSSGLYDAVYRQSADGTVWSEPFTLNTQPSCSCWGGVNGPGKGVSKIGDYIGIDARAGRVVAAWPDNRDPSKPQNIYARVGNYDICAGDGQDNATRGETCGDAEPASALASISPNTFKTVDWPSTQATMTTPGRVPNFISSLMLAPRPDQKTEPSAPQTDVEHGARRCAGREFARLLRHPSSKKGPEQTSMLGCHIETAFEHVQDVAERTGYRVALEDLEGVEAELLLAKGRSHIIFVKLLPSQAHAAETDVVLRRLDY